jgi:hypothetical protein
VTREAIGRFNAVDHCRPQGLLRDPVAKLAGAAQSLDISPQAVASVEQLGNGAQPSRSGEGRAAEPINISIAKIVRDDEPNFRIVATR